MTLPNAEHAFVDIAKLRDYSLDPVHPEGKHKARVFAAALGLTRNDANWLCEQLRSVARTQECSPGRKTFTASDMCWISRWFVGAKPRACAARGTCGPMRISLD